MKNLRFAALLLLMMTLVFSCQKVNEMEEIAPEIAMDLPTGATPCSQILNTFNTTHSVQNSRVGSSYQFTVMVQRSTQCNMISLSGTDCQHVGDRYLLNTNPSFNLNYSQFSNIQTLNLSGATIPHYINPEGTSLQCNFPFIARFTWNTMNLGNPTPSVDRFNSGGVCIIGIIQDPNGSPNNNG